MTPHAVGSTRSPQSLIIFRQLNGACIVPSSMAGIPPHVHEVMQVEVYSFDSCPAVASQLWSYMSMVDSSGLTRPRGGLGHHVFTALSTSGAKLSSAVIGLLEEHPNA